MKCEEVKKILLEEEPEKNSVNPDLLQHITTCDNCSRYYEAKNIYNRITDASDRLKPEINLPVISDNVMESIEKISVARFINALRDILDSIVFNPVVRTALSLILISITILFMYEEYDGLKRISRLEARYRLSNSDNDFGYQKAESFTQLERLAELFANGLNLNKDDETVIDESDLLDLFGMFINRELFNNPELQKYLTDQGVDISDGLNTKELKILITNKNALRKILIRDINRGDL